MTKLKNTKKGMAKKALSISLVAAMLATSNVPVWAAEDLFSDGSAAVEAPAVEEPAAEVDTFSAEPVEDAADAVQTQATETGTGYEITTTYTAPKSIVWGGSLGAGATITVKPEGTVPSNIKLKAVWKADGLSVSTPVDLSKDTSGNYTYTLGTGYQTTVNDCDKSVVLYVYAEDTQTGNSVWSYTSDATKVDRIDISEAVKVKETISEPNYDGNEHKLTFDDLFENQGGNGFTAETVNLAYSGDLVNVTDEGVTVTLTAKLDGYKGSVSAKYQIKPMVIDGSTGLASEMMKATLTNSTYTYTGKSIGIKKSDVKLVDLKTESVDLSNYLYEDENGYVGYTTDTQVGNNYKVKLNLIIGQPISGCKNYIITNEGNTDPDKNDVNGTHRTITASNQLSIAKRDLSSVNVTIPAQTGSANGKPISINKDNVKFTDKNTGETLTLKDDVEINVPSNAINKGTYTATIVANDTTKNVTGETTATFNIVAADISSATFANEESIAGKQMTYTGEQITFTAEELGALKDNDGKVIDPSEYSITFGTNVNVVDGSKTEGVIIVKGKGSFEGSEKRIYFDITPASLDKDNTKANQYVERIDTQDYSDYADAMGVVVKAKNSDGKTFTLKEGTDYTVKYNCTNNNVKGQVTADITIISDNFKGGELSYQVSSEITARAIKDENIKFRKSSYTYTGKPITPEFDVVIDGKIINPDLYTATVTNNLNAGTATVTVTGKDTDKYSDKVNAKSTFTITPESTSNLEGTIASQEYTGYSLEPNVDQMEITLNGEDIDISKDFTITYGENVNIGEGTVTLTPKNGNFTGSKTFTFQITGEMLTEGGSFDYYNADGIEISAADKNFTYDGTAHSFAKTVFTYGNTSKKLVEGTDYEIVYVDNVYGKKINNAQTGVVLAVAKGKYGGNYTDNTLGTGTKNGIYTDAEGNKIANVIAVDSFVINQLTVSKSNVAVANATYAGGLPVKPVVSIIVNGKTLVEGQDYELDLSANKDLTQTTTSNELKVTINPKNGYKGTGLTFNWGIDKFNLANADVSVDGETLSVKCGRVDVESSEYTVTKDGSKLTISAVEGSKNYTGSKTIDIEVEDEKPAAPVIQSVNVNGNNATVVLAGESDGATGYDYVISKDRDCITSKDYDKVNKNVLTTDTTFTYTQQGVYYAYCHAWKRVDGEKVFSDWSAAYPFVVSSITPEQPSITKVEKSSNGKHLRITWTKSANATGYDVVMGTKLQKVNGEYRPVEYGKAVKKVTNGNTVSVIFYNIPKGTYYVGLHAYNRSSESGVKVFSQWSNSKKVTF